jgi:hypothetical protein
MTNEDSAMVRDAMCGAAEVSRHAATEDYEAAMDRRTPSYMYRPKLSIDGNQWCALYGENLQEGVAGFGDSPEKAYLDFDRAWFRPLPAPKCA